MEHERLSYYRTGGSVRLTESGCLGACGHGPTLVCYRDHEQAWYAPVSTTEALEIARSAHADDALPTKNRFDG